MEVINEYIVGVDVSSERSDQLIFIPFLDKLDKSLPQKYEKSKKRKFKTDISKRENMQYDKDGDFFI